MFVPKKILVAVGGAAILAAGIWVGVSFRDRKAAPALEPTAAIGGAGQSAAVVQTQTDADLTRTNADENTTPSFVSPSKKLSEKPSSR